MSSVMQLSVVGRVSRELGRGYLATADGEEIAFDRASVTGGDFDLIDVGTPVRFLQADGETGRAVLVEVAAPHAPRPSRQA